MKLQHLDLFSGIGGFSLGLEATGGFETKAFCDIEEYPRQVLQKHWPHVKQYKDIKELTYERLKADGINSIDIITGGYPCQPFSVAGKQKGVEDKRHLWPEYFRLIKECRPTWVIGENVSGHIKLGLDSVIEDLESENYSVRPFSISASSVGANHQRERIWIVAYSECNYNFNEEQRVNGEEKEISREHRENDSTTWKSSGTNTIWKTNNGDVGDTSINRRNESKSNKTSKRIVGESKEGRMQQSEGTSDVEDTRCTQWPRAELREENENEIGQGNANQHQRSSSPSTSNVANTENRRGQSTQSKRRKGTERGSIDSRGIEGERKDIERDNKRETKNMANTDSEGSQRPGLETDVEGETNHEPTRRSEQKGIFSDAERLRQQGQREFIESLDPTKATTWQTIEFINGCIQGEWPIEPNVGRVANGVPKRVDRLKSLGNSLVPQIPYYIGCSILESLVADTNGEKSQLSKKTGDDGEDR